MPVWGMHAYKENDSLGGCQSHAPPRMLNTKAGRKRPGATLRANGSPVIAFPIYPIGVDVGLSSEAA